MSSTNTLKERFDKAFYGLLEAGNRLQEVSHKVEYAGKLIQLNKIKQKQIEQILEEEK